MEDEIGRAIATREQISDAHDAVPHKTEGSKRELLRECSGSCESIVRGVRRIHDPTERDERAFRSDEVVPEAHVQQFQEEAACA